MWKCLSCLLTIGLLHATDAPFWRAKDKAYDRIKNGEILVSVVIHDDSDAPKHFTLQSSGGGRVEAPRDFVFALAQKYNQLGRATDYIQHSSYDASKHEVTMDIAAFGHKTRLVVGVRASSDAEPWNIEYEIKSGALKGMTGRVSFTVPSNSHPNLTEVGFSGNYAYSKLPIPKMFVEFGFEVVLQKMAARLRAYSEEEWRHNRPAAVATPPSLWNNPARYAHSIRKVHLHPPSGV